MTVLGKKSAYRNRGKSLVQYMKTVWMTIDADQRQPILRPLRPATMKTAYKLQENTKADWEQKMCAITVEDRCTYN